MVVKIYISGISGNKEVKKRQQRVVMILDSKHIGYEVVDITEPGREVDKDFMQTNSTSNGATISDQNPRHPLPPQIFNDEAYCGDYDQFDMANEVDELEVFLKISDGKKSEQIQMESNAKSQSPPREEVISVPSEDTNGHRSEEIEEKEGSEETHEQVENEEEEEEEEQPNNKNGESTVTNEDEVEGDVAA